MFLQHLQNVIVSSLSSNMQGSHKAGRHNIKGVITVYDQSVHH